MLPRAVGCELAQIVKSIVFVCDGAYVLALVPGDRRADERAVAAAVEATEIRAARGAEVVEATGFEPGGVAPFPQRAVARTLMDRLPAAGRVDRSRIVLAHGFTRSRAARAPGRRRDRSRSAPTARLRAPRGQKEPTVQETEKIWMNGELVDWADAKVHVGVHGLHYGSGVFEGIRCYETPKGPAVFRLGEHLQRLHNSAKLLHMEIPFSPDELKSARNELLGANGLPECYIRPIAFYGFGELGVPRAATRSRR